MKKVIALPKYRFEELYNNHIIKKASDAIFISILDPDNNETRYDIDNKNILQVKMWDVDDDMIYYGESRRKADDNTLELIIDFIELNKHCDNFIIHCTMGVSRSGAIARFIHDTYDDVSKEFFNINNRHIKPNIYILNRLKRLHRAKY